jgi:serine O-acetyltransferase
LRGAAPLAAPLKHDCWAFRQAVHQMLDHAVNTDQRIDYILEQLKRLGVPIEDEKATADKFDANYLNRIVD